MKRSELVATYLMSSIFVAVLGTASPAMAGQDPKPDPKAVSQQRALDLEHDMVQTDGVNHPRQKVTDKAAPAASKTSAPTKKTQADLDHEHERLQSDGTYHSREVIKK